VWFECVEDKNEKRERHRGSLLTIAGSQLTGN
jgi:hypothetical protein